MSFAPKNREYHPPFSTIDGAHTARFAHFTSAMSSTRACLSHVTRSRDEKASRKVCSSYGAEYVGKIQYSRAKTCASGSAYQPGRMGFPERAAWAAIGSALASRILRMFTSASSDDAFP